MLNFGELSRIPFSAAMFYAAVGSVALLGLLLVYVLVTNRRQPSGQRRGWIGRSLYGMFLSTVCVLAFTSFAAIARHGHMLNYALLLHIAAAGAFTFLLLAIAWMYLPWIDRRWAVDQVGSSGGPADQRWWFVRMTAWVLVISSLVSAGTMFASMLPILDTSGLLAAASIHRYAGLCVTAFAAFHLFALGCVRFGLR